MDWSPAEEPEACKNVPKQKVISSDTITKKISADLVGHFLHCARSLLSTAPSNGALLRSQVASNLPRPAQDQIRPW